MSIGVVSTLFCVTDLFGVGEMFHNWVYQEVKFMFFCFVFFAKGDNILLIEDTEKSE